jgi:ribosomal protein L34E
MPKGAFICKGCKKGFSPVGFLTGVSDKYRCSKHGEFCSGCIVNRFFGGSVCPKCDTKVIRYEFKKSYEKWMKV